MTTKYAIRITRDNHALIRALSPTVDVQVTGDPDRFFLFEVDAIDKAVEHDIVQKSDLAFYDGHEVARRVIF